MPDLRLINASNGSGEAVRSLVTVQRLVGSMVQNVDATTNWPAYFIATTGSLDTNGRLNPTTMQVFKGHKSGSTYVIDSFAPGYTDKGNAVGDVVLVKPTTAWADEISSFMGVSNNQDGTLKPTAVQTALENVQALDWLDIGTTVSSVTNNGNRNYSLTLAADITNKISAGMRLRLNRTVASPTQSALLNGTNQYFNRTTLTGMTFTDDFVAGAWIKMSNYTAGSAIMSRFNGSSGWILSIDSNGRLTLAGYNGSTANSGAVTSVQSIPLNKWVHVAAQLDMSAFSASATTSYIMIDGYDSPATVSRAGTNPASLVQAGDLNIGAQAGSLTFPGRIAQAFVTSAKMTQDAVRSITSQSITSALATTNSIVSAYTLSGVNGLIDINTTNANNLTAQNTATTTNNDAPFGQQANNSINANTDYGIVQRTSGTTIIVQVPEGNTVPTSGGITSVQYATAKTPYGMPLQRDKWTLYVKSMINNTQSSPTANTWYGTSNGTPTLNLPIGEWNIKYQGAISGANSASAGVVYSTLSTSTSAETIKEFTAGIYLSVANAVHISNVSREYPQSISVLTPYYHIFKADTAITAAVVRGDISPLLITAENALL